MGPQLKRSPLGLSPLRRTIPYLAVVPDSSRTITAVTYKGFAITPRTFQIHGSGRWTLDLLIGRHRRLRAFSGEETYATEQAAIDGCRDFGRRIIDGLVQAYPIEDLP